MSGIARWFKGNWPLMAFALYWLTHLYIWGVWGWREAELFNAAWWFDTAGHTIFGMVMATNLLYNYKKYAMYGSFRIFGQGVLADLVTGKITKLAVYWELGELAFDFLIQPNLFTWMAKAQKGSADTIVDIVVTIIAAEFITRVYRYYNKFYKKRHPTDTEDEITEEMISLMEDASQEINSIRKGNLKKLIQANRQKLKEFLRNFFKRDDE